VTPSVGARIRTGDKGFAEQEWAFRGVSGGAEMCH
jgi:hypothetical protein